jgi:hypothetical protein
LDYILDDGKVAVRRDVHLFTVASRPKEDRDGFLIAAQLQRYILACALTQTLDG